MVSTAVFRSNVPLDLLVAVLWYPPQPLPLNLLVAVLWYPSTFAHASTHWLGRGAHPVVPDCGLRVPAQPQTTKHLHGKTLTGYSATLEAFHLPTATTLTAHLPNNTMARLPSNTMVRLPSNTPGFLFCIRGVVDTHDVLLDLRRG